MLTGKRPPPIGWGAGSMQTSKSVGEILA